MAVTVVGMCCALLVDVLIAARFGTSEAADALILALTVPVILEAVTREASKFSLVPLFVSHRATGGAEEFVRFVSALTNAALALGVLATITLLLFAPSFIALLGPGLSVSAGQEATTLFRVLAPTSFFALGATILGVSLNSRKIFLPFALRGTIAPALVAIAFAVAWGKQDILMWVGAAHTIGFSIYFVLLYSAAHRCGHHHMWTAWPSRDDWRSTREAISFPLAGFAALQSGRALLRAIATLLGPGAVAAFYFSSRLILAGQTAIGVSLATTRLPWLAGHAATGRPERMASMLWSGVAKAAALSVPVALFAVLFREQLLLMLFARGAFDASSVAQSESVFLWLALGLPFLSMIPILQVGVYAHRRLDLIFRAQVVATVTTVGLAALLVKSFGIGALGMAVSGSAVLSIGYLALHLRAIRVELDKSSALPVDRAPHEGINNDRYGRGQ